MAGWVLFAISGVFFLIIAVRDGDMLVMASAIAWLLGVMVFVYGRWGPPSRR
jgi:hypothetical protein